MLQGELLIVFGSEEVFAWLLTTGVLASSYCVVNDVSSRGLCAKGGQWGVGKTFDGPLRGSLLRTWQQRPDTCPRARQQVGALSDHALCRLLHSARMRTSSRSRPT